MQSLKFEMATDTKIRGGHRAVATSILDKVSKEFTNDPVDKLLLLQFKEELDDVAQKLDTLNEKAEKQSW